MRIAMRRHFPLRCRPQRVTNSPRRIDDDSVDVAATAETYATEAERFVEKYRDWSLTSLCGETFRQALPDPENRPARVLDLGCGPGADTEVFADSGLDALGLDITQPFLRAARDEMPAARFMRGDMRQIPVRDDAVDGLWSSAAFLHLPRSDAEQTLAEFARVLRSGGPLLLSAKAREAHGTDAMESDDGRRFTLWRADELRRLLENAGFAPETLATGPGWHTFLAIRD